MLKRYEAGTKDIDVTLQYIGGSHNQMKYWIDKKIQGMPSYYRPQKGNNLGEKLKLAISDSFGRGHQYVVVIGKYAIFIQINNQNKKNCYYELIHLPLSLATCMIFKEHACA